MNRVNLVVDIGLFFSTVTAMLSGFMVSRVISGFLGFSAPGSLVWHTVHSVSVDAVIAVALLHTALHWKWFVRVLGLWPARSARPADRGYRSVEPRRNRSAEPVTVMARDSWWTAILLKVRDDYHRSQYGAQSARTNRGSR